MNFHDEITAFILAAGYSSRMGQFKPLLPLGSVTALERSVQLFFDAGIRDVRAVVGYQAENLVPLLRRLGVRVIVNELYREGMLTSIQAGIKTIEPCQKAFFILPVDIPLVRRSTLLDLLCAYSKHDADVLYPCFLGKRGHPPLIRSTLIAGILSWNEEGGLRSFFRQRHCSAMNVEVADEHILLDMDSPAHYEKICQRLEHYDVPSSDECTAILTRKFLASADAIAHSKKMAHVALQLAKGLNSAGCDLDVKLVVAASLLHDLIKLPCNGDSLHIRLLLERDHPAVAKILCANADAEGDDDQAISERDVVGLADTLVHGDQIVPLDIRDCKDLEGRSQDSRACHSMAAKLAGSLELKKRIEARLGDTVESLLKVPGGEVHVAEPARWDVGTR